MIGSEMSRGEMMKSVLSFLQPSGPHSPDGLKLLGLLLTPVAVAAGALAAWRFGVDAGWTSTFFIAGGFLSHWQVWSAFAISAEVCAYVLRRAPRRATAVC
jgi:hypothetical protein